MSDCQPELAMFEERPAPTEYDRVANQMAALLNELARTRTSLSAARRRVVHLEQEQAQLVADIDTLNDQLKQLVADAINPEVER